MSSNRRCDASRLLYNQVIIRFIKKPTGIEDKKLICVKHV